MVIYSTADKTTHYIDFNTAIAGPGVPYAGQQDPTVLVAMLRGQNGHPGWRFALNNVDSGTDSLGALAYAKGLLNSQTVGSNGRSVFVMVRSIVRFLDSRAHNCLHVAHGWCHYDGVWRFPQL